jgi:uridylate kinase
MDPTAITQCMEHDMPILVFNFKTEGNIERAACGEQIGTLISSKRNEAAQPVSDRRRPVK